MRPPLAVLALLACLGLSSKPDSGPLLSKAEREGWTTLDFQTATCGYAAPIPLTFSVPPGYVVRDPKRGVELGCFWGREDDLDRAFRTPSRINLESLGHGVFQARWTSNVAYDPEDRKFTGEEDLGQVLAEAGMTGARVGRRELARHPALVITARRPNGLDLYLLYVARGTGADVLLISYRPAVPATPADSANWRQFLDSIR
jgi:hypothetical protein